ncbi:MAG: DUF86 domain-containing protein [Candidatus Lokiarchaeota archaeon]|nr:DUF86 domain-containing protein [Candidatus Lokiarchaeota archaeon]
MSRYNDNYLHHILDSILRIERFTEDVDQNEFNDSELIQSAVIRQIEIIGEATKHISKELKNEYTYVPWNDIAGMRDKLIHGYLGVDIEIVWDTLKKDIPQLKRWIEEILEE